VDDFGLGQKTDQARLGIGEKTLGVDLYSLQGSGVSRKGRKIQGEKGTTHLAVGASSSTFGD